MAKTEFAGLIVLVTTSIACVSAFAADVTITDRNGNKYTFLDTVPCKDWALAEGSTCEDIVALFDSGQGDGADSPTKFPDFKPHEVLLSFSDSRSEWALINDRGVVLLNELNADGKTVSRKRLTSFRRREKNNEIVGISANLIIGSGAILPQTSQKFAYVPAYILLDCLVVDKEERRVTSRQTRIIDIRRHLSGILTARD